MKRKCGASASLERKHDSKSSVVELSYQNGQGPSQPENDRKGVTISPQLPQPTLKSRKVGTSGINSRTIKIQCWAHTRLGVRCSRFVRSREGEPIPIPYCQTHMKNGDGALTVVDHPFAGKCLVARFDLPAKYRIAFWGKRGRCERCDKEDRVISFYPPNKETGRNKEKDGSRKVCYNGVLNPCGTGDIIQYAACPGPNERQNMRSTFQYWGLRNGNIGGLEFITLEPVHKNSQLCHWYGPGWWNARGVVRKDVGTQCHPAPKRIRKVHSKGNENPDQFSEGRN